MQYAPICLFTYNRLWHTQRTIASLLENSLAGESDLIVFSDGPKNDDSIKKVVELRKFLSGISGFKSINIIEREENFGLARSIIEGVTALVNQHGRVIVVEDDLEVSPHFLRFMNEGLARYQDEEQVASIHGYAFPLKEPMPQTYFLRGADCWGWATWKRAWNKFEPDGTKLLEMLTKKKLTREFDFQHTQRNIQMLKDQIAGKNNSWAIRWHASAFVNNMLTLYPGRSLVRNSGFDNSGEHCVATSIFDVEVSAEPVYLEQIPIGHNNQAYDAYVRFFKSFREPLFKKLVRKIRTKFYQKMGSQHA